MPGLPVHCHLLCDDARSACEVARGDLTLSLCKRCGHGWNSEFDPAKMEYSGAYENSLHGSPTFQAYAKRLAKRLVERYDVRNRQVLEIGCGRGEFLDLICQAGGNRGLGFEPSTPVDSVDAGQAFKVVQEFYPPRHGAAPTADLVCCRHVLEHVAKPADLVLAARQALADRPFGLAMFEVPNLRFTLRDRGVWDLIYEHCGYFSRESLTWLFETHGFQVQQVDEVFGGQFLAIEALPSDHLGATLAAKSLDGLLQAALALADNYRVMADYWQTVLNRRGGKTVIWGAGSKTVTFLNALKLSDQISLVVDINRRKWNRFVAGSGHRICSPEALAGMPVERVLVMNPMYREEVAQAMQALKCDAEVVCVSDVPALDF